MQLSETTDCNSHIPTLHICDRPINKLVIVLCVILGLFSVSNGGINLQYSHHFSCSHVRFVVIVVFDAL